MLLLEIIGGRARARPARIAATGLKLLMGKKCLTMMGKKDDKDRQKVSYFEKHTTCSSQFLDSSVMRYFQKGFSSKRTQTNFTFQF